MISYVCFETIFARIWFTSAKCNPPTASVFDRVRSTWTSARDIFLVSFGLRFVAPSHLSRITAASHTIEARPFAAHLEWIYAISSWLLRIEQRKENINSRDRMRTLSTIKYWSYLLWKITHRHRSSPSTQILIVDCVWSEQKQKDTISSANRTVHRPIASRMKSRNNKKNIASKCMRAIFDSRWWRRRLASTSRTSHTDMCAATDSAHKWIDAND